MGVRVDTVAQGSLDMLVESFFADEELARTADLSSFDESQTVCVVCRMVIARLTSPTVAVHVIWPLLWAARVGRCGLKQPCFCDACFLFFFIVFHEGGICPPDTWAAGVAQSLDSLALVVL